MHRAFRKYGLENFSFEIIRDDFDSIQEMQSYEQQMILYYDTVNKGYNQTYNTDRPEIIIHGQKCALVDTQENILEKYSSYHEAARKNGQPEDKDWASNIRLVCKGENSSFQGKIFRDLDKDEKVISKPLLRPRGKKSIVGINVEDYSESYYESISEASRQEKIPRKSLTECIKGNDRYGIVHNKVWREVSPLGDIIELDTTIQDRIDYYNKRNPIINGERHTIPEWSKIYNVKVGTVNSRIRKGMSPIEALTTPLKRK